MHFLFPGPTYLPLSGDVFEFLAIHGAILAILLALVLSVVSSQRVPLALPPASLPSL